LVELFPDRSHRPNLALKVTAYCAWTENDVRNSKVFPDKFLVLNKVKWQHTYQSGSNENDLYRN
jgi:hypothetical protein